jgi:hypothetical protein
MAATLAQVYGMQGDALLKNRTTAAIAKLAYYIVSTEPANTENHANRLLWAKACLLTPEPEANRMLWAILQNTDVQDGIIAGTLADSLIEYVVGVLCNTFATGS